MHAKYPAPPTLRILFLDTTNGPVLRAYPLWLQTKTPGESQCQVVTSTSPSDSLRKVLTDKAVGFTMILVNSGAKGGDQHLPKAVGQFIRHLTEADYPAERIVGLSMIESIRNEMYEAGCGHTVTKSDMAEILQKVLEIYRNEKPQ